MRKAVFIHTNNKQFIGGQIGEYAIKRFTEHADIEVHYINVDTLDSFKKFAGKSYIRGGKTVTYDPNDLQSFTLSRFMPPELMNYEGRAIVIDPDIFALGNIQPLFDIELDENTAIACCSKKDAWDTSVMLMDCAKLKHWSIDNILTNLENKSLDYADLMTLKFEKKVRIKEIPRIYNNLDTLTPDTVFLHTTDRLTQPWRTGLPIDFTRNDPGKYFGIIPKIWGLKLRGKWPTTYQPHPNPEITKAFFKLLKSAIDNGFVKPEDIDANITKKFVRPDIRTAITKYTE